MKLYTEQQLIDYANLALKELALIELNPEVENINKTLPKLPESFQPQMMTEEIEEMVKEKVDIIYLDKRREVFAFDAFELGCKIGAKAILSKLK